MGVPLYELTAAGLMPCSIDLALPMDAIFKGVEALGA